MSWLLPCSLRQLLPREATVDEGAPEEDSGGETGSGAGLHRLVLPQIVRMVETCRLKVGAG